jgi:hypothetical protein
VHVYLNYTKSLRRVVNMLGRQFSKPSLHNWLRSHPATRQHHTRPAAVKITKSVKSFLADYLNNNPFHTMEPLVAAVKQELQLSLGRNTVCRAIMSMGFSRKRTHACALDTDRILAVRPPTTINWTRLLSSPLMRPASTSIPATEAGMPSGAGACMCLCITPPYKYMLLLEVSSSRVLDTKCRKAVSTARPMPALLDSCRRTAVTHTSDGHNVTFHESKVVKEALAAKNLTVLYSPPYSPEYDPVQMAFFGVQSPHACNHAFLCAM